MAYEDDSQDYQAKPKAKFKYKKELRIRDGKKQWVNVGRPIEQPKPFKTSYGSVITGEHEPKGGKGRKVKYKGKKKIYANKYK